MLQQKVLCKKSEFGCESWFLGTTNKPTFSAFKQIDNVQTLAFMVWCAELHTNRASIFCGSEA